MILHLPQTRLITNTGSSEWCSSWIALGNRAASFYFVIEDLHDFCEAIGGPGVASQISGFEECAEERRNPSAPCLFRIAGRFGSIGPEPFYVHQGTWFEIKKMNHGRSDFYFCISSTSSPARDGNAVLGRIVGNAYFEEMSSDTSLDEKIGSDIAVLSNMIEDVFYHKGYGLKIAYNRDFRALMLKPASSGEDDLVSSYRVGPDNIPHSVSIDTSGTRLRIAYGEDPDSQTDSKNLCLVDLEVAKLSRTKIGKAKLAIWMKSVNEGMIISDVSSGLKALRSTGKMTRVTMSASVPMCYRDCPLMGCEDYSECRLGQRLRASVRIVLTADASFFSTPLVRGWIDGLRKKVQAAK